MIFLALIYVAFISLGLPDSLLGTSWPFMYGEFSVPVGNAGFISAIVSSATVISSLLSSRLISRFGTGRVTLVSVAMTAVGLLGFSLSPTFWGLLVCAVPLGLGAGAVDSGLNEFVAEHYQARHMNWLHSFWGVGAMLGPVLVATLHGAGGSWRMSYRTISIIQWALVVVLVFSLPLWKKFESPEHLLKKKQDYHGRQGGVLAPLRFIPARYAVANFFLYTTVETTMILWGASFLVNAHHISPEMAAVWVSVFFLGITAGRTLNGFIAIKIQTGAILRFSIGLVITALLVLALAPSALVASVSFLFIGLGLAPIFPSMLHQTPIYFGREIAQEAMGLQMACAYVGTTLMPPLLGQLFSRTSFAYLPGVLCIFAVLLMIGNIRLLEMTKKVSAMEASTH